ncbi:serine-rich adhesin for platelets isoform X7 [Procambarus clarkii]|uniref:serine-rich adhesin for platelets isoform X7 n=1 Tax=Procambarus clarkii TaxID=6728 RepID=UPI001E675B3E|nr:serine-rich adhesin for platelets-like isoform X5 [Procambarus clarkii]
MRVASMRDGGMLRAEGSLEAPPGHHTLASHTPYAASSSSSSSSAGGGRVKVVRLVRRNGESYGFSLRGGREHGTGFFISHVEAGSEAFLQGLRAGDQVLKVNNLCVEQAVHREVTAMVQSKASVLLKVKSAGIIPLKEHRGDPLTWLVVDDDEDLSDHGTDTYSQSLPSSAAHESDLESFHHINPSTSHPVAANDGYARVYLSCTAKVGLGCSICKGPAEKPGIFVQSVRVGGVAKNAGLRPGDQIIACNDISFTHLEFAEAVYVLKSSPRLALDVLRGAGLDLVAGESSGYNSSASSVAGDQTPPSSSSDPRDSDHSITTRLSAVSRHLNLDRTRGWREIESEWAEAEAEEKRRQLQSSQKTLKTRAQRDASHRLSSVGTRSLSNLSAALREEEDEQRTVFRDGSPPYTRSVSSTRALLMPTHAHYKSTLRSTRSSNDVTEDTNHKIALVTSADPHVNNIVVTGGPKDERDAVFRLDQLSSPSASRTSTLSSGTSQVTVRSSSGSGSSPSIGKAKSSVVPASVVEQQLRELREEQRRLKEEAHRLAQERRKFEEAQQGLSSEDKTKAQLIEDKIDAFKKDKPRTTPADPKRAQHDKLMEEFKLAHKKMFIAKDGANEDCKEETCESNILSPPKDFRTPPSQVEFSSKIISNSSINHNHDPVSTNNKGLPLTQSNSVGLTTNNIKSKFMPKETSSSSSTGRNIKETIIISSSSASSKISSTTPMARQQWNERSGGNTNSHSSSESSTTRKSPLRPVSVAVMEEFKPEDKTLLSSRAPSSYFEPPRAGLGKPLVSIGAYPSPNHRPAPLKMDFLSASRSNNSEPSGVSVVDKTPVKACLQQELVSTLSRSNLRQRYTPKELSTDHPSVSSSTNYTSAPNSESISTAAPSFTTTSIQNNAPNPKASLSTKYRGIRQDPPVTIIMKGDCGKENEAPEYPPTGILKPSGPASTIRPLQKSISFGDVTTVGEDDPRT